MDAQQLLIGLLRDAEYVAKSNKFSLVALFIDMALLQLDTTAQTRKKRVA